MVKELPNETFKGAYVTGPYTIAGLLLGADEAAMWTITNPDMLHQICSIAEEIIIKYTNLLSEAGAEAICILEPSAVMLSPNHFEMFSANYIKQIIAKSKYSGNFIYHVCGNSNHIIDKMIKSGVDALSLDSKEAGINLLEISKIVPNDVILIGNINPVGKILNGNEIEVEYETYSLLEQMHNVPNFILSTGCDLPFDTPIENIAAFVEVGKQYKKSVFTTVNN
jgi:uroporphyrinogen decarboxylase